MIENICCWLAYRLPRRLAYWAAVRVMAHASVVNPTTEVGALSPADCLKAWKK
jgi:hypothetical protein